MEIYRDSTGNQVPKMVRSINDAHNVYIKEKPIYEMLNLLKRIIKALKVDLGGAHSIAYRASIYRLLGFT